MRYLEDLRDKHKGRQIWIVGTGHFLDDLPDNFFSHPNRISIAVNWAISAFPDCTYSIHEHREPVDWLVKDRPEFLKKCILLLPPHRIDKPWPMVWWEDYNEDPIYMKWGRVGILGVSASDEDFKRVVQSIMKKEPCGYVCRGTTAHWAVEAAAVLGAERITLVGCEACTTKYKRHAQRRGLATRYPQKPGQIYPEGVFAPHFISGHRCLARLFKPYGIELVSYNCKKVAYEKI